MLGFTHCGGMSGSHEIIMQDRRGEEWSRLAMRGLQLLEDMANGINYLKGTKRASQCQDSECAGRVNSEDLSS